MKLNAALPADMRAAETGVDAAPTGAKTYVKPAMQVFPLGCGLLATSGAPVDVFINAGFDFYSGSGDANCRAALDYLYTSDVLDSPVFSRFIDTTAGDYLWIMRPRHCFANPARSVTFGSGGEGWSEADFLANVIVGDFVEGSYSYPGEGALLYHQGSSTDPKDLMTFEGSYNGQPVLLHFSLSLRGYNGS